MAEEVKEVEQVEETEEKKELNYFEELYSVNVNEHTEGRNGFTYVSWTYAWAEVKKRYPDAQSKVYESADGCFYHTDGRTAWVKTGVTINGIEHIEYLPVMDFRNKSIPVENVTSMDVNKAIQRSITKACARHGLGLYIYAGEDLPEAEKVEQAKPITEKEVKLLEAMIDNGKIKSLENLLKNYKVNELKELTNQNYGEILHAIRKAEEKK